MCMKKIIIAGANGFIASNLARYLSNYYQCILVSRYKSPNSLTYDEVLSNSKEILSSCIAVVNLAGSGISDHRWSMQYKKVLIDSRVNTARFWVELLNQNLDLNIKLINASAIGIYQTFSISDESTLINYNCYDTFSQEITKKWEQVVMQYDGHYAITRFGVVLSSQGGAFPKLYKPFKYGIALQFGDGTQMFSWVSLLDVMRSIEFIIKNSLSGVFNVVAPDVVPHAKFMHELAIICKTKFNFVLPDWLIRLIFGQMGKELFLDGVLVKSNMLEAEGFCFKYRELAPCLYGLLDKRI
jgi:uncharacterized protein